LPVGKYVIRDFAPYSLASFERPEIRSMFAALAPGADLDDRATRRRLQRETSIPTAALDELRRLGYQAARGAPRVSAPTLIFQGTQDPTTLPRHSRTLARRMGAELREVPGDHLIVDPSRPCWPEVRDRVIALAGGTEPG
jgi:pimeloyl-ACP methyl ester carboxylesterase